MKISSKNRVTFFIQTLWDVINTPTHESEAIKWNETGLSFYVIDEKLFSDQILSKSFKHSNFSSFVRQLNMYNFRKVRTSSHFFECFHQLFRKDHRELLVGIKRKPTQDDVKFGKKLLKQFGLISTGPQKMISSIIPLPTIKMEEPVTEKNIYQTNTEELTSYNQISKLEKVELWHEYTKVIKKHNDIHSNLNRLMSTFFVNQQSISKCNFNFQNFLEHFYSNNDSLENPSNYLPFYTNLILPPHIVWNISTPQMVGYQTIEQSWQCQ